MAPVVLEAGAHPLPAGFPIGTAQWYRQRSRLRGLAPLGELTLRPRLLVGADGRQSIVRRLPGANVVQDPVHHQFAGCLLQGIQLPDDAVQSAWYPGGWIMAARQGHNRVRIYVVCYSDTARTLSTSGAVSKFIDHCAAHLPDGAFDAARPAGPLAFFPNADVWADRMWVTESS